MDLFHRLNEVDGNLSVFAEDLGIITDDVHQLLTETGYPGMNVLQFAFVKGQESVYLPFHQKHNSICYARTHDNDTLLGWLHSLDDETRRYVFRFTRSGNCEDCAQALIDLAWQRTLIPVSFRCRICWVSALRAESTSHLSRRETGVGACPKAVCPTSSATFSGNGTKPISDNKRQRLMHTAVFFHLIRSRFPVHARHTRGNIPHRQETFPDHTQCDCDRNSCESPS